MFRHIEETPLIFYFDGLDEFSPEQKLEFEEWFIVREVAHTCRTLTNEERRRRNAKFELIFAEKSAAMEFKLTFL